MDFARKRQRILAQVLVGASVLSLSACAHNPPKPEMAEITAQGPIVPSELEATRQQVTKLQDRIQDLETRLSALNDKINLENGGPSASSANAGKLATEVVEAPAAHGKVIPPKKPTVGKATPSIAETERGEGSASSSEAVDRFREAKILYDTKRYSDSVLEFAEFVKNDSDHVLAPAAQYYVGMSYYKQNEYKLAEEELNRGLLAYAHSNYVPDTLLALYQVSGSLKKTAKVTYYREKLITNFPNSPQAKKLSGAAPPVSEAEVTPGHAQVPAEKNIEKRAEKNGEKPGTPTEKTAASEPEVKTPAHTPVAAGTPSRAISRAKENVAFEDYTPTPEQEKMMDSAEEPSVVSKPELPASPKLKGDNE